MPEDHLGELAQAVAKNSHETPQVAHDQSKGFFSGRPHFIPALIAAAMLLAALWRWPYGYYQLMRWVVCAVALFIAIHGFTWRKFWATWLFGFVVVLFNPFVPIRFDRETWQFLDVACAVVLLAAMVLLCNPSIKGGGIKAAISRHWRLVTLCAGIVVVSLLGYFVWPAFLKRDVPSKQDAAKNSVVVIETSMGTIKAELWADKAPETAANFLRYTDEKFYDGLIFHRVIDGFMVQGGGFTPEMRQKPVHEPIKNEASADKPNARGTLAMARTNEVHSATAQFFINLVDNKFLNHTDETPRGFGYCAFGKVVEGMDVVDKIAKVGTGNAGPHQNVPTQPIVIKSIRRAE